MWYSWVFWSSYVFLVDAALVSFSGVLLYFWDAVCHFKLNWKEICGKSKQESNCPRFKKNAHVCLFTRSPPPPPFLSFSQPIGVKRKEGGERERGEMLSLPAKRREEKSEKKSSVLPGGHLRIIAMVRQPATHETILCYGWTVVCLHYFAFKKPLWISLFRQGFF